jgi:type VI secretion system secreted protein VgrG
MERMPKHVKGIETMCGGVEYRLLCVAIMAGLPLKQFNAMGAELQFVTDKGSLRSICGIVAQAAEGESDGGLATYQLVVRDALTAPLPKTVSSKWTPSFPLAVRCWTGWRESRLI